jgi:hypothetical protein
MLHNQDALCRFEPGRNALKKPQRIFTLKHMHSPGAVLDARKGMNV